MIFTAVVISAAACHVLAADTASAPVRLLLPDIKVHAQQSTLYRCAGDVRLQVHYLDTDAGAFAYLPVADVKLLFVNVAAGSGAKYVSGPYVWWSKGRQAFLADVMQPEEHRAVLMDCNAVEE